MKIDRNSEIYRCYHYDIMYPEYENKMGDCPPSLGETSKFSPSNHKLFPEAHTTI